MTHLREKCKLQNAFIAVISNPPPPFKSIVPLYMPSMPTCRQVSSCTRLTFVGRSESAALSDNFRHVGSVLSGASLLIWPRVSDVIFDRMILDSTYLIAAVNVRAAHCGPIYGYAEVLGWV